jgi:hypothetical protein
MWIRKRPEDSLTLAFALDRKVTDIRISQVAAPRPGCWVHHLVIPGEDRFDEDAREWLQEAFRFGNRQEFRTDSRP